MQQVRIDRVVLEGFGSYANSVTFKFDVSGLFVCKGENGTGKTTLFSALYWCLYKQTLNDVDAGEIPTFKHLRPSDWKGTRVVVDFVVEDTMYRVARHINFKGTTLGVVGESSLMLFSKPVSRREKFTGEDMVGDALYKKDQQAYINHLLGVDAKTFIASIIFGQRMNRLVGADGKEKRDLFEQLFEIDFLDIAKDKADKRKVELETSIFGITTKFNNLNISKANIQNTIDRDTLLLNSFEQTKKEKLAEIKKEHESFKEQRDNLFKRKSELEDKIAKASKPAKGKAVDLQALYSVVDLAQTNYQNIKDNIDDLGRQLRETDRLISLFDRDAVKFSEDLRNVKDTCTLCGQKLKPAEVLLVRKNLEISIENCDKGILAQRENRGKIVTSMTTKAEQVTTLKDAYDDAYKVYMQAKEANKPVDNILQTDLGRITGLLSAIVDQTLPDIKARYAKEKAAEPPKYDLEGLGKQLRQIEATTADLDKEVLTQQTELEKVIWWIKKGFGASGIKSYVFSAMLSKLNEFAAKYATYFGFGVKFWVDMSKASKPFVTTIYRLNGTEQSYKTLSGGQKQRIDLALAFAMHDLVCVKSNFNILVMDEVFEGLNSEGVEMCSLVMSMKAETKAVYLITHQQSFSNSASKTFEVSGGINSTSVID